MRRADSATLKPLIFVLLLVGLVGCNGEASTPQPTALPAKSPTPTLPFDVELTLWHPYTDTTLEGLEALTSAFNTQQDQIRVVLEFHRAETLLTDYEQAVRGGQGPDIWVGDYRWIAPLANSQLIYPLGADFRSYVEDVVPYALAVSLEYRHELWGVPLLGDTLVLYMNGGTAPSTLADLLQQPILIDPDGVWALFTGGLPHMVDLDGRSAFLRLDFTTYLRTYQQVAQHEHVRFTTDITPFINKEVALYIGYASQYPDLKAQLGDSLTVASLTREWRPLVKVVPLLVSGNAPDTSVVAATRFFAYCVSAEGQRVFADASGQMPLIVGGQSAVEQTMLAMLERSQALSPYPIFYETVLPVLETYLERALIEDVELLADEFFGQIR